MNKMILNWSLFCRQATRMRLSTVLHTVAKVPFATSVEAGLSRPLLFIRRRQRQRCSDQTKQWRRRGAAQDGDRGAGSCSGSVVWYFICTCSGPAAGNYDGCHHWRRCRCTAPHHCCSCTTVPISTQGRSKVWGRDNLRGKREKT